MNKQLHPVDAAIGEWSDLYAISYNSIWHARLRTDPDHELLAFSFGELRGLMLADPRRREMR